MCHEQTTLVILHVQTKMAKIMLCTKTANIVLYTKKLSVNNLPFNVLTCQQSEKHAIIVVCTKWVLLNIHNKFISTAIHIQYIFDSV